MASEAWNTSRVRYYHKCQIGVFEFDFYGKDDRQVLRIFARWLSLFYPKRVAELRMKKCRLW